MRDDDDIRGWRRLGRRTIAGALLPAVLLAAACGSDRAGGDEVAGTGTGEATSNIDDGDRTPKPGGSITYAISASTTGGFCIPEAVLAPSGIVVAGAIYDPLFAFNDQHEPTAMVAETYDMSADGRTHTITLREGITFSDGSALDAAAVKLNIDTWRGAAPETGRLPLLFSFVFSNVENVEAPDARTVVVTSRTPWVAFPDLLASGRFGIAAPAQITASAEECAAKPIGSGPFMVEGKLDLSEGADVKLVRNPNHWRTDSDGNRLPYLDAITFRPIVDPGRQIASLTATGGIDVSLVGDGPLMQDLRGRSDVGELKFARESKDHAEVSYVMFNASRPPFDDVRARRLLAHAVDRELLNQIMNNGEMPLADGPFGPGVMGYLDQPAGLPEYDPVKAEELSKEIGGLEFTLIHIPAIQKLADEAKRQLELIPGVKVKLAVALESALTNATISGDFDAVAWANHPGTDPDNQYYWWRSDSVVNFGGFEDPEIDRMLDLGRSELDPEKRRAAYERISERFAEEYYNGWIWYALTGIASRNEVYGMLGRSLPNGDRPLGIWAGTAPVAEIWVER